MSQCISICLVVLLFSMNLMGQKDALNQVHKKNPMEIVRGYVQSQLDSLATITISEEPSDLNFYKKELEVRTVLDKKCSFLTFQIPQNFEGALALYFSSPVVKSWGIQPINSQSDITTFTPCFLRVKGMLANTTFQLNNKRVVSKESGLFNKTIFIHDGKCLDETSFIPGQTYFLFFQVEETLIEGDHFDAFISLSTFENKAAERGFRKKIMEAGKMKYLKK